MRTALILVTTLLSTTIAVADITIRNSPAHADNEATFALWLDDVGIAEGDVEFLVNFESGVGEGQNVSGVPGLFAGGLVIVDTSGDNEAIISGLSSNIGGSNPIGTLAVTHNEEAYLELDFSIRSVDYVSFFDIDQSGVNGIATFEGGENQTFNIETTATGGNSAEFYGIFRNDKPRITRIQLDASGDREWAIDDIRFGRTGVPDVDDDGIPDSTDNCIDTANADQRDTDGDGFGNICDADLDDSCMVNFGDVAILKSVFLTDDEDADFNGDGTVNFGDVAIMKSRFLQPPGPSGAPNGCEG